MSLCFGVAFGVLLTWLRYGYYGLLSIIAGQVGGGKTEDEAILAKNQIHSVSAELSSIIIISVRKPLFDGQILAKVGIW